jgi:hypothetical protein
VQQLVDLVKKGPNVASATRVGDPTMVDPDPVAPSGVIQKEFQPAAPMGKDNDVAGVTIINPNQPAGGSAPPSDVTPGSSPFGQPASGTAPPATPDPNELKPNAPADPNELKPADSGNDQALPPPPQVNEIHQGQSSSSASASADNSPASDQDLSSSKKKKKKGLKKIIPF